MFLIFSLKMAVDPKDVTSRELYKLADLIKPKNAQSFVLNYLEIRDTEYK